MSKIKALLISLALLTSTTAFAYYNFIGEVPLPGKTQASPQLQQDTIFSVGAYGLRIATKDCFTVAITNTSLSLSFISSIHAWIVTYSSALLSNPSSSAVIGGGETAKRSS